MQSETGRQIGHYGELSLKFTRYDLAYYGRLWCPSIFFFEIQLYQYYFLFFLLLFLIFFFKQVFFLKS